MKKSILVLSLLLIVGVLACRDRSMERAGEKAGEAMERAGEKVERTMDKAGEKLEDAGDRIIDKTKEPPPPPRQP